MNTVLLWLLLNNAQRVEHVRVSAYAPGDGYNAGNLACGGKFTDKQLHVAHRRWRQLGCHSKIVVYSADTGRFAATYVMDAGPFGITNKAGDWKVWTKSYTAPKGWWFRGGVDFSIALWKLLGRPRFLSKGILFVVPERLWRLVKLINEIFLGRASSPPANTPTRRRRRNLSGARYMLKTRSHSI